MILSLSLFIESKHHRHTDLFVSSSTFHRFSCFSSSKGSVKVDGLLYMDPNQLKSADNWASLTDGHAARAIEDLANKDSLPVNNTLVPLKEVLYNNNVGKKSRLECQQGSGTALNVARVVSSAVERLLF